MKYFICRFGLITILLIGCNKKEKSFKLVQYPVMEPTSNYYSKTFNEVFFNENHYGVVKLFNSDSISNVYSSETFILIDSLKRYYRNCKAILKDDSLFLKFNESPLQECEYGLNVLKVKKNIKFNYYQIDRGIDIEYGLSSFTILNQNLILNKEKYSKGDSIKGKIALKIQHIYRSDKTTLDTFCIYGLFKTVVE